MYAKKKKGVNKKVVFAIALLVLIVVVAVAVALYPKPRQSVLTTKVGVKVGDYFTYSLSGWASGPVPSTISTDFSIYNDTSYYKVTVTAINGTKVTLDTDWVLNNGTSIDNPQTIDLASGILSDQNGFYALYPAGMNANQTIYPHVYQDVWVNGTDHIPYTSGTRASNYYSVTFPIYYTQDPTHSTMGYTSDQINFDRDTGMLTDLYSATDYNNPEIETKVVWELTGTNAWTF
jgi:hypothetical protein